MQGLQMRALLPFILAVDVSQRVTGISPSCYGMGGGETGACEAGRGSNLFHIPERWSGGRALKQEEEWGRNVELIPPVFVTWVPADRTAMAAHGFSIDAMFGCGDRSDWSLPWPPPLDVYFSCNDYAPGGVNDLFCDIDSGWAFTTESWMLASEACPRACQSCCYQYCDSLHSNRNQIRNCETACEQPFEAPFFNGTHNTTEIITDPYLAYLNYRGTYTRYMELLEATEFGRTAVFEPVEFFGGEYLEAVNVSMLTLNSMVNVRYTTDRSTPSFRNGQLGNLVTIDRITHLQAVVFEPDREIPFQSAVASVDIRIKTLPPIISILECETDSGTLVFNASFVYVDQLCFSARVQVTAVNRRADVTFLRYAIGGQLARPSNPQGQSSVVLTVAIPGEVTAVAWVPDMVASEAARSPYIRIPALVAVSRGWQGTVGLWELMPESFLGVYERERSSRGGCGEVQATRIEPAMVADATELLGPAVLQGPACKGGVWDLGDGLSPDLRSFVERDGGGRARGLRFDSLNRGLYVADDVSALAPELLPRAQLTVEAMFSVDGEGSVALGGLVGCRLDAAASGGFRYGKGWSLGYSVDAFADATTVIFSLALEGNEVRQGLGGMRDFAAEIRPALAAGEMAHVAGVYDGRLVRVYVNGALATEAEACGERWRESGGCGDILYPLATDDLYTQGRAAPLTLGVIDSSAGGALASHVGVMRMARVLNTVLSAAQIEAGARRRALDGSTRLCPLGRYGPYEGLEPCRECESGFVAPDRGLERCEACAPGFFTEGRGATDCLLCPPGTTTAREGSSECTADDCLLGTHTCHAEASCTDTGVGPRSYACECNAGYVGDGEQCGPLCGDGVVVGGEGCDDGNARAGDGCSRECEVEAEYRCSQEAGGASKCECLAAAHECCSRAHALCRQLVEEGMAEQASCLSEYGACLQSTAGAGVRSPDVLLGTRTEETPAGSGDCNALLEVCTVAARKSDGECLRLYSGCLKALDLGGHAAGARNVTA